MAESTITDVPTTSREDFQATADDEGLRDADRIPDGSDLDPWAISDDPRAFIMDFWRCHDDYKDAAKGLLEAQQRFANARQTINVTIALFIGVVLGLVGGWLKGWFQI
jgi:hypothetical protein